LSETDETSLTMTSSPSVSVLDPYKLIPNNMIIPRAGNRLYDNGLSPIRSGFDAEPNSHKRLRFIVTAFIFSHILRFTYFGYDYLTESEDNERLVAVYLGDFSYYLPSVRIHWIITCINIFMFDLLSQLLHHFLSNRKTNRKTFIWLNLFMMLSGEVIPARIGITEEEDVIKIVKRYAVKSNGEHLLIF